MWTTIFTILGSLTTIFATWYGGKFVNYVLNRWNQYLSERKVKDSQDKIAQYIAEQEERNKKLKEAMDGHKDSTQ